MADDYDLLEEFKQALRIGQAALDRSTRHLSHATATPSAESTLASQDGPNSRPPEGVSTECATAGSSCGNLSPDCDLHSLVNAWAGGYVRGSNQDLELVLFSGALGDLSPDYTTEEHLQYLKPYIEKRIAEDRAFLNAKFIKALAGPVKLSEEEINEIQLDAQMDRLDTVFRRHLVLVPGCWSFCAFVDFMEKAAEDVGQDPSNRELDPERFSLLSMARVQHWKGEALRQIRGLEIAGHVPTLDERTSCLDYLRTKRKPGLGQELVSERGTAEATSDRPRPLLTPDRSVTYPKRAAWLSEEMDKRQLSINGIYNLGVGPDPKTTKKILKGEPVARTALLKLASRLEISVDEIPGE